MPMTDVLIYVCFGLVALLAINTWYTRAEWRRNERLEVENAALRDRLLTGRFDDRPREKDEL